MAAAPRDPTRRASGSCCCCDVRGPRPFYNLAMQALSVRPLKGIAAISAQPRGPLDALVFCAATLDEPIPLRVIGFIPFPHPLPLTGSARSRFFMLDACQWDDALAPLKEVHLGPKYLMHMADPDHPRYGHENKEMGMFLAEAKTVESSPCLTRPPSRRIASLRASLDTCVDRRFLLTYLDAWRSTSDAVNPAVEVVRLHLLLKLDRGPIDDLDRLVDDLAARGHAFAKSLVAQRASDVRRVLDLWQSLVDSTPPSTAAPGSEPHWVSVPDIAQLLADLDYAASHVSDIQWLLARDRALASHLVAYLEDSNGPREVLVRAYLAEGWSIANWLNKYRAASVPSQAAVPDFLAAQRPASEVRGQLVAVHGRVCETEEVPFEVVVDAFLKMDGRNVDMVDFRELANVLPGDWALEGAAPLLMYEIAQLARRHRWSTMVVKSLECQPT
ncbi:hypothetical protein H9P43_008436 [Blastocladiella emersonii ATCC 22665]|nr:hypothetical protein H9P43_008436 [Blastocladiella emersonii ATCC 22665]